MSIPGVSEWKGPIAHSNGIKGYSVGNQQGVIPGPEKEIVQYRRLSICTSNVALYLILRAVSRTPGSNGMYRAILNGVSVQSGVLIRITSIVETVWVR